MRNGTAFALALALGSAALSARPALATDTFVDWEHDRSAWEAAVVDFETEPFDNAIAQSDVLDFDFGIQSVASGANEATEHFVDGTTGRFRGTLRTSVSSAPGYLSFVWTFPEPVMAFGADFFSIGGDDRRVSVRGTFDSGLEAFDLRTLFGADGGVDAGFFGLTSTVPFTSITLIALGTFVSNDAFTIDNVSLPEPANSGLAALAVIALLRGRRRSAPRRQTPRDVLFSSKSREAGLPACLTGTGFWLQSASA